MLDIEHPMTSDPTIDPLADADSAGGRLVSAILEKCRETRAMIGRCDTLAVADVHCSRKNLKKIRAGIKLLGDADGFDPAEANRLCREVGRLLSGLRDTDVCLLTLEGMDPGLSRFAALAGKLRFQRNELHQRHLPDAAAHREIVTDLLAVESILLSLLHDRITTADLHRALKKTRRRARKRYVEMDAGGNPHAYHDFRKAAKRELYQARYLGADPRPGRRLDKLDRLGDCLGRNQDLVVLREMAGTLGELDEQLSTLIDDERKSTRAECRRLARELYGRAR
jgi:CHAD domain-containing protein